MSSISPETDDKITGVPQFEVAPEMIEAGVAALRRFFADDDHPLYEAEDIVTFIYEAIEARRRASACEAVSRPD